MASVSWQDDLVSVEADGAVWSELIAEFTRRTGIRLHVGEERAERVSVSFKNVPLDRAMKELFGAEAGYVFLYDGPSTDGRAATLPFEIFVFPRESDRGDSRGVSERLTAAHTAERRHERAEGPAGGGMSHEGEASPEVILDPGDDDEGTP